MNKPLIFNSLCASPPEEGDLPLPLVLEILEKAKEYRYPLAKNTDMPVFDILSSQYSETNHCYSNAIRNVLTADKLFKYKLGFFIGFTHHIKDGNRDAIIVHSCNTIEKEELQFYDSTPLYQGVSPAKAFLGCVFNNQDVLTAVEHTGGGFYVPIEELIKRLLRTY